MYMFLVLSLSSVLSLRESHWFIGRAFLLLCLGVPLGCASSGCLKKEMSVIYIYHDHPLSTATATATATANHIIP